jgi:hypothetical protein
MNGGSAWLCGAKRMCHKHALDDRSLDEADKPMVKHDDSLTDEQREVLLTAGKGSSPLIR